MIIRFLFLFFLGLFLCNAQEEGRDDLVVVGEERIDTIAVEGTKDPLRASVYSAVLPGLGQYYNERYWKTPVVLGLLGTGAGIIVFFNGQYRDFRDAFIAELNGQEHEFTEIGLSAERLAALQDDRRRSRDYAIAFTSLFYILNIVDAAVDAHLFDFDAEVDFSWNPNLIYDQVSGQPYYGITLRMNF